MRTTTSIRTIAIVLLLLPACYRMAAAQDKSATTAATTPAPTSVPGAQKPTQDQPTAATLSNMVTPFVEKKMHTDCLDYQVEVISLIANNNQMFWKQDDCIRVHVTNNPFLFKYTLSFNEVAVKEDDPLGAFGKILGVNVSGVSGTGENSDKPATDASTAKKAAAERTIGQVKDLKVDLEAAKAASHTASNKAIENVQTSLSGIGAAAQQQDFDSVVTQSESLQKSESFKALQNDKALARIVAPIENLPGKTPTESAQIEAPDWSGVTSKLTAQADAIETAFDRVRSEYRRFSDSVPDKLAVLSNPKTPLDNVATAAKNLRDEAQSEVECLDDGMLESYCMVCPQPEKSKCLPQGLSLERRLVQFAHDAATLHQQLQPALPTEKTKAKDTTKSGDGAKTPNETAKAAGKTPNADPKTSDSVAQASDELHAAGEKVAYVACAFKAIRDNDLASVRTRLIAPLNAVLTDGLSFGYRFPDATKKREGPFGDPMSVTMTLKRDPVHVFATASDPASGPTNTTSSFSCSSDTTDMFENGGSYTELGSFFTDKPVQGGKANTYTRNQNKPQPAVKSADSLAQSATKGTTKDTEKSASDEATTAVLEQPWFFGKARLVVSGGLSTGFLRKQEFQRSTDITGTPGNETSTPVIGLKTDTRFRLTPMLYGHVLLGSGRHDADAWYGTFGVTANSDNKGTSPEFLLGLSRSFAQQKFFATFGAYIGEQQRLDGGLQVGQVIPSSLSGELPVTKGYRVGFGIGLSFRFASTKDPQKDSATAATQKKNAGGAKK